MDKENISIEIEKLRDELYLSIEKGDVGETLRISRELDALILCFTKTNIHKV